MFHDCTRKVVKFIKQRCASGGVRKTAVLGGDERTSRAVCNLWCHDHWTVGVNSNFSVIVTSSCLSYPAHFISFKNKKVAYKTR